MDYEDSLDAWDEAIAEGDARARELELRMRDRVIADRARAEERDRMRRELAPPPPMDDTILVRVSITSHQGQWCLDHRVDPVVLRGMRGNPGTFLVDLIGRLGADTVAGWLTKGATEAWRGLL